MFCNGVLLDNLTSLICEQCLYTAVMTSDGPTEAFMRGSMCSKLLWNLLFQVTRVNIWNYFGRGVQCGAIEMTKQPNRIKRSKHFLIWFLKETWGLFYSCIFFPKCYQVEKNIVANLQFLCCLHAVFMMMQNRPDRCSLGLLHKTVY